MQRTIDIVQCRFGYNGTRFQHPRLSGTDSIDSFITFLKIKNSNGLQTLQDFERSDVLGSIKRIGAVFAGPLYPQEQCDEAKNLWSELILGNRIDLDGFTQQFVWSKILEESQIVYYFRCPNIDCMHHTEMDIQPDLSSIAAMNDLGFSRGHGHRVNYVSGDLEVDLAQYRVTCPTCQTPNIETWCFLPASTWILRYYRKQDDENNFAPSNLKPSINTYRGVFTLSYVEILMVVRERQGEPLKRHHGAIFHVSNRYFVFDPRIEQGKFFPLDLGFDWEQVLAYLQRDRNIVHIEWRSALYSKVLISADEVSSAPPSSDDSATSTSSKGPSSPEVLADVPPGTKTLPITWYHGSVSMGKPRSPSNDDSP